MERWLLVIDMEGMEAFGYEYETREEAKKEAKRLGKDMGDGMGGSWMSSDECLVLRINKVNSVMVMSRKEANENGRMVMDMGGRV